LVSVDGLVSGGLAGKTFGTGAGFGETVAFVVLRLSVLRLALLRLALLRLALLSLAV